MTRERQAVRLIIPVHLFGLCCDMDAIMEIAREFELLVMEDAAQAIGAGYPQTDATASAGTIGDVGCFSFYPSKNLGAAGDAGAIICDNETLATRIGRVANMEWNRDIIINLSAEISGSMNCKRRFCR
jgi:dTDP-4-amino-4,6-dideoxygalactose transaminase